MSSDASPEPRGQDYALMAIVGLLFITVVLVQEGLDWWAALPLVVGAVGVWRPGMVSPSLVLLAVMMLMLVRSSVYLGTGLDKPFSSPLVDLLLAVAALLYLVGQTRLMTIRREAAPSDARRARKPGHERLVGRWLLPRKATKRSGGLVVSGEVAGVVLRAPVFALVAYLLWVRLALEPGPEWIDVSPQAYKAIVVVWTGVIALCGCYVFLAYLGRAGASREQSLVYLQDQLWDATRGEQRSMGRWLTRARLRRGRKEEGR